MVGKKKCPKCGGKGKKISGRVMLLGTHRTYGYGERVYECVKCKTHYSIFYPIPPKSGMLPSVKDNPDEGLLRPGWLESVSGHAYNIVIGADIPGDDAGEDIIEENESTQDETENHE